MSGDYECPSGCVCPSGCDICDKDITPCIDLANIAQGDISIRNETDVCRYYLEPIDIPYRDFHILFFYNNGVFTPNKCLVRNNVKYNCYIVNSCQCVKPAANEVLPSRFNLYNILKCGFSDIASCWDTCTRINFNKKVSKINTLFDLDLICNIDCSLTLDELFDTMQDQNICIDPTTGMPAPNDNGEYPVVPVQITTSFKASLVLDDTTSETEGVSKTVEIVWQFDIDFDPNKPSPCGYCPTDGCGTATYTWCPGDRYKLSYGEDGKNDCCNLIGDFYGCT
jgi:hypothetical protein